MTRHPWDRYDTPHAAISELLEKHPFIQGESLLDPCAGDGRIAQMFMETGRFSSFRNNDLDPATPAEEHRDARDPHLYEPRPSWTITNPPYLLAPDIARVAIEHSKVGVALLLRCTFLEPCQNRAWIVEHPPTHLLSLPRLSFTRNAKTDFVPTWWFVWVHGQQGTVQVASRARGKLLQLTFPHLSSRKGGANMEPKKLNPPSVQNNFLFQYGES